MLWCSNKRFGLGQANLGLALGIKHIIAGLVSKRITAVIAACWDDER